MVEDRLLAYCHGYSQCDLPLSQGEVLDNRQQVIKYLITENMVDVDRVTTRVMNAMVMEGLYAQAYWILLDFGVNADYILPHLPNDGCIPPKVLVTSRFRREEESEEES